jgi:hypothetical protein
MHSNDFLEQDIKSFDPYRQSPSSVPCNIFRLEPHSGFCGLCKLFRPHFHSGPCDPRNTLSSHRHCGPCFLYSPFRTEPHIGSCVICYSFPYIFIMLLVPCIFPLVIALTLASPVYVAHFTFNLTQSSVVYVTNFALNLTRSPAA